MRATLRLILSAPTWREFKESIYALHQKIFAATRTGSSSRSWTASSPTAARSSSTAAMSTGRRRRRCCQQTHKELAAIVEAIAAGKGKQAEALMSDHLMRMLATVNIWQ